MSKSEMIGDSFRLGYRFQRHWDVSMASAFFCGELGAGVFLVSMIYAFVPGLILGLVVTGLGKTLFHLLHMGVPGKSWRAMLRPDRSWISRGLIAIVVFCGAGILHTAGVILGVGGPLASAIALVAGAAALVVMTYQGFAMGHSSAIALWSSAIMPFSSLLYALTGGVILVLLMQMGRFAPESVHQLVLMARGLLLADLIMLFCMLHIAYHGSAGSRLSAQLLASTLYATWFNGVVVGAGILLPLMVLWLSDGTLATRTIVALGVLAGFYAFRVLIFKAGVYDPIMTLS